MIFNIVVDAVVRATLEVVYSPQEERHGIGWAAGDRNLIFYTDDKGIWGRDHIRLKDSLTVSVSMLRWLGLEMNLEKTKVLVCTSRYI